MNGLRETDTITETNHGMKHRGIIAVIMRKEVYQDGDEIDWLDGKPTFVLLRQAYGEVSLTCQHQLRKGEAYITYDDIHVCLPCAQFMQDLGIYGVCICKIARVRRVCDACD